MLKQICFDRFVGLSWLALVAASSSGCGAHSEPGDVGATKGDAGPALRGHVGGALDAGADLDLGVDASPVIDATVPVDTKASDVPPPPVDSGPLDLGHPDLGQPDLGRPDLGPPDGPPRVCVTQQLIVNPAFDLDPLETGWTNPGNPMVFAALAPGNGATNQPDVAAQSLPNLSWFGGYQGADDRLSQSIAIPAGATQLTFSLFYAVVTGKTGVTELDTFDATLLAGTQVVALAHLSNLNATDTWTPVSAPLPATLAGQTVTLQLRGVTNANANRCTSFYLDTMSLQAVTCP